MPPAAADADAPAAPPTAVVTVVAITPPTATEAAPMPAPCIWGAQTNGARARGGS